MNLPSTLRRLVGVVLATVALSPIVMHAAHAGEAEIRKNLAATFPKMGQIDEIRKSPMPGLYEVRVGFNVVYTDENGNYLLQGSLIDVKNRRDLTEERVNALTAIKFDELPVKDAVKIVRGNGKRKLAVFEDPNCGYCKIFEKDLRNIDNVTVYLFLYPILGEDSHLKARDIWCSKNPGATWVSWMVDGVKPTKTECDTAALQRNVAFGQKHNITGTPTLLFTDGARIPGAVPAAQIEKMLTAAAAK